MTREQIAKEINEKAACVYADSKKIVFEYCTHINGRVHHSYRVFKTLSRYSNAGQFSDLGYMTREAANIA